MDDALKEQLVAQFRAYLEAVQCGAEPGWEGAGPNEEDRFSMLAELAGMKSEVKRESRQVKEALDQFRSVFDTLQSSHDVLIREFEQRQIDLRDQRREVLRPLLIQLLEIYDRLAAGANVTAVSRRSVLARLCRQSDQLLDAVQEGQRITLRRLDQILAEYHVRPLETLDKPHDPHTMRVVEVESRADIAQGRVTGELRKGFFWGDELLRPAEVKVNKREGIQ